MNWSAELAELEKRRVLGQAMGGPEKIERQHRNGKLTVRERIEQLVDKESFVEVGGLAGSGEYDEHGVLTHLVPSNVVLGRAQIDQRPVVVIGDDFTVRGGANDGAVGDKMMTITVTGGFLALPFSGVPEADCNWEKAMQIADMALYLGKVNGRNRAYGLNRLLAPYEQVMPVLERDISAALKAEMVELVEVLGPEPDATAALDTAQAA